MRGKRQRVRQEKNDDMYNGRLYNIYVSMLALHVRHRIMGFSCLYCCCSSEHISWTWAWYWGRRTRRRRRRSSWNHGRWNSLRKIFKIFLVSTLSLFPFGTKINSQTDQRKSKGIRPYLSRSTRFPWNKWMASQRIVHEKYSSAATTITFIATAATLL